MAENLYWLGNAAKMQIVRDLLAGNRQGTPGSVRIFDYGCGDGGGWPAVLIDHPNLELICYDPSEGRIARARKALEGLQARFVGGAELKHEKLEAQYVVSFSVLEHVYDRQEYVNTAKMHLAKGGVFYLNYDDGHFRIAFDADEAGNWLRLGRQWLDNLLFRRLAAFRRLEGYQARVQRADIDAIVTKAGFQVERTFYSNLGQLKWLAKTVPPGKQQSFARLWLELEGTLNIEYRALGPVLRGDPENLWQIMGSRTLVLKHGGDN